MCSADKCLAERAIGVDWEKTTVFPERVLQQLKPGQRIFLGTGMAEPRTLVKGLLTTISPNLKDLELLQLGSFSDTAAFRAQGTGIKYRLKTFFPGFLAEEAIAQGRMDLIPCRPSKIPALIESGRIPIDAVFFQRDNPALRCVHIFDIKCAVLPAHGAYMVAVWEVRDKREFLLLLRCFD